MVVKILPQYDTLTFTQVFENDEDFFDEFNDSAFTNSITEASVRKTYWLLYARFGNTPIQGTDVNLFAYKIWTTMFKYGPTWEKKLSIQETLRSLTDAEIVDGTTQVVNNALNDQTTTGSGSDVFAPKDYSNNQTATKYKKSKLQGFGDLMSYLENDVTSEYIERFAPFFRAFVEPQKPVLFVEEEDEEE